MKVWFSIVPGHGHFFPMVPLGRALQEAGHKVTFCSSASYGKTIRDHGFESIAVGLDYTQGGAKGDATKPGEVDSTVAHKMFVESPPMIVNDLMERFHSGKPDAMLFDPWERGGMAAAEASDVPWGVVLNALRPGLLFGRFPFDPEERSVVIEEQILGPERTWRERAGLPEGDRTLGESPFDRTFILDMVPPSLSAWPREWTSHVSHPLRPEAHQTDADEDWTGRLAGGRPVVAISLGTLFGSQELYERSVSAALETGATVVAVTGFDLSIDDPNLVTVAWASMDRLLAECDVFVHHGGWGSTIAGLDTGTPAVVVPLGSDQFHNGARLTSAGAGLTVDSDAIEDQLAPAIRRLLDEPVFSLNARRLQGEIKAMPPARAVIPLIERLAKEGPPVFNR